MRQKLTAASIICFFAGTEARRVQRHIKLDRYSGPSSSSDIEDSAQTAVKPSRIFATFLLALHPTVSFQLANPRAWWLGSRRSHARRSSGFRKCVPAPLGPRGSVVRLCSAQPHEEHPQTAEISTCKVWPCWDALDKEIITFAFPILIQNLILPLTGWIDLVFIGKLGNTLAVSGQQAANQVLYTAGLLNVIPSVALPAVAKAHSKGDKNEVQRQVEAAIFLALAIGALTSLVVGFGSSQLLLAVGSTQALAFSLPYLSYRLSGVIPDTVSTAAFSVIRGVKDSRTPLIVSFVSCMTNAIFNYLLMFPAGMGIAGAGLATAISQIVAGVTYCNILLKRRLMRWRRVLRPPPRAMISKLATSVGVMQIRNVAFNICFLFVTKITQVLDTTGTAAAAHAITIQLWLLGGAILLAMGQVAAALVGAELGRNGSTPATARALGKRFLAWGALMGTILGALQVLGLPLLKFMNDSPEVQKAARLPSVLGATLQPLNGVVFVGEGLMQGAGAFSMLARGAVIATIFHRIALTIVPSSLDSVWACFWVFNLARLANFIFFWLTKSPLRPAGQPLPWETKKVA